MEAYQERVVQEKKELDVKIEKLIEFLKTDKALDLVEGYNLLWAQHKAMAEYSKILGDRIEAF